MRHLVVIAAVLLLNHRWLELAIVNAAALVVVDLVHSSC